MRARDGDDSASVSGSALGYALLSLLTRGPATGYQLTQRMKSPIGHFWTAKHSQIYPELARLAAATWVELAEGAGPGPRAKKTYTLTPAGLAALGEWLVRPPVVAPRSETVLKAYAANSADPVAMADLYARIAARQRDLLDEWEQEAAMLRGTGHDRPDHPGFGNYAVLLMGIESARATGAWAQWLATCLRTGRAAAFGDPIPSGT
ncbi:negative transcription regulator PadR [Catellatospora sp. TT07R-123]|uniref:PadR family transcriptional regulator n=1 Tax=Catellatospora sp. TT07R-123 TaxID=2733863 RepID=UPI001B237F55|nr:PadR family transcriptional regulator [Catellatospora sp. TT07R-123]GHJ50560.1 negative transcription regulator PadR [Catellatospora sp. TT07R-123]